MLSGIGRWMTLQRLAFAIAMITAAQPAMSRTAAAAAAEPILDDSGGRIGAYLSRYEALRKSGQHVAIDGTLCVSMHAFARRNPARSHLCDAACSAGFPRRLGSQPDGCSDQRSRDQIFVVALSGRRAPVDRAARRIAIPNDLSGRA